MKTTTEFSFILKPSQIHGAGVGVFAVHGITKGTKLVLHTENHVSRKMHESEVPKELLQYCVAEEGGWYLCPEQFNRMEIGWFVNHSDSPNIAKQGKYFHALRSIKAGQEITMDYGQLHEPKSKQDKFYK